MAEVHRIAHRESLNRIACLKALSENAADFTVGILQLGECRLGDSGDASVNMERVPFQPS